MYDSHELRQLLGDMFASLWPKITLGPLMIITAILTTISLFLAWPPAANSSSNYSPWKGDPIGITRSVAAAARSISTPSPAAPATQPAEPTDMSTPTTAPVDPMFNIAPTPTATVPPPALADAFTFIVDDGLYPGEQGPLTDQLHQALEYVSQRFGSGPASHFNAVMTLDGSCFLHGVAHTEERTVQVSTCNAFGRDRSVSIMAHEFVHQLAQDRYGPRHLGADLILAEGVATWGAGAYWLGGASDFRSYVRSVGVQYPLTQSYEGLGVNAQNGMYYQWASFVEFLIGTYGREKFDQVYVSGKGDPGSADYQGIYGKNINALDQEWQAWLYQ